jgi:hypothetical protein
MSRLPPPARSWPPTIRQPVSRRRAAILKVTSGHYRITGSVSRGGIGRVLHALDQVLDRPVALKELFSDSDGMRRRCIREALITAQPRRSLAVQCDEARRPLDEAIAAAKTLAQRRDARAAVHAGDVRACARPPQGELR